MTCPSMIALAIAMAREHTPGRPNTSPGSTECKLDTTVAMADPEPSRAMGWRRSPWLWLAVGAVLVAIGVGGHALITWIEGLFDVTSPQVRSLLYGWPAVALLLLYIFLLSLPFVPGAELGIFLLVVFGSAAAIPVYAATVAALLLSFSVGRLVPLPRLIAALNGAGLTRAASLLSQDQPAITQVLQGHQPQSWSNAALDRILGHRCIALAILFNTPGNALIGGGGGIALAVGASRLLTLRQFIATVLVAVAPVPTMVLIASLFTSN